MSTPSLRIRSALFDDLDLTTPSNPIVGRDVRLTLNTDPLALSCTLHRMIADGDPKYYDMFSKDVSDNLTEEDLALAETIRDYYGKQLVWAALNSDNKPGKYNSEYQEALTKFIKGDKRTVMEKDRGMVYRIPEYYYIDTQMDIIKRDAKTTLPVGAYSVKEETTFTLTPVQRFKSSNHLYGKNFNYWFKDSDGYLYQLSISQGNALDHVMEHLFDTCNTMTFTGHKMPRSRRDGFSFYQVEKWKLDMSGLKLV